MSRVIHRLCCPEVWTLDPEPKCDCVERLTYKQLFYVPRDPRIDKFYSHLVYVKPEEE
jgi:hypothetical protein